MQTLTALFIGLGSIGTRHLNNLAALCEARGWALQADALRSDPARPLRPGAAERLRAQYTDAAQLPPRYDLIFITNPTSLHAEALRAVYGRGGALFIEKPIFSAEQTGLDLRALLPAGQKAYVPLSSARRSKSSSAVCALSSRARSFSSRLLPV